MLQLVTKWKWNCSRCGYIHISIKKNKLPARCPVFRSTHLKKLIKRNNENYPNQLNIVGIYRLLEEIPKLSISKQEIIRKIFIKSGGVHILCIDQSKNLLR